MEEAGHGETYYGVLGLEATASAEEIKRAYLKLARLYHPDRAPGDKNAEERFARISRAYQVLSSSESRYAYDLELGIEPGGPAEIPTHKRIAHAPVTGSEIGDYIESLVGGVRMPLIRRVKDTEFRFEHLEDPKVRQAYEQGMYSIGRLESSDSHQLYELGMASLRKEEWDRAVAYFVEAAKLNPGNIRYRFGLGCALEAKGLLKEASVQYENILGLARAERYPCQPVREALVRIYLRMGEVQLVKKHCKLLWELGLVSAVAEEALRKVRGQMRQEGGQEEKNEE